MRKHRTSGTGHRSPAPRRTKAARVRDEFPLPSFGWTRVCIAASAPRPSSGTCLSFAVRRPCQGDAPIGPPRGDINLLPKPDPLPGATPPLARSETAHSPDVPAFIATSTLATSSLRVYVRGVRFRSTPAREPGVQRPEKRAFFRLAGHACVCTTGLRLRNA